MSTRDTAQNRLLLPSMVLGAPILSYTPPLAPPPRSRVKCNDLRYSSILFGGQMKPMIL
jgi:hypothetical protein